MLSFSFRCGQIVNCHYYEFGHTFLRCFKSELDVQQSQHGYIDLLCSLCKPYHQARPKGIELVVGFNFSPKTSALGGSSSSNRSRIVRTNVIRVRVVHPALTIEPLLKGKALSTIDLLVMIACFVKKKHIYLRY